MSQDKGELWVLGNGPSLRDFDFSNFAKSPTLGMNAAYRYWRRIGWRPTYYCCLDDALIDTHKSAIVELIEEDRIEKFFLTARLLEHFPWLSNHPRIRYMDEFVEHWHRVRGCGLGLKFTTHPAFKTNAPDMLTTGAYSVRFAAYLGYQSIRLSGVDLTYHPVAEARELGGTRLEMNSSPDDNPNYFFRDYQLAGDQFNVANPSEHGRELHLHSFIALRDDFLREGVNVSLENTSLQSKLFTHSVLPYAPPGQQPEDSPLSKQLVLKIKDASPRLVESVLWLWSTPDFFPVLSRQNAVTDLVIEVATARTRSLERATTRFLNQNPMLRACFRDVKVRTIGGATESSLGARLPEYGARIAIDADTIPLSCDWLSRATLWQGRDDPVIELEMSSNAFSELVERRVDAPLSVFVRVPGVSSRLSSFRNSSDSRSLAHLLRSSPLSSENDAAESREPPKRRLSLRSMLPMLFK